MNWGEATVGTDLDGCSVISRHADDVLIPVIVNNAVIVIHIPSEEDLQPWLLIGYAGDMAPYSGISSSGLSIFSTVLDDQSGIIILMLVMNHLSLLFEKHWNQ